MKKTITVKGIGHIRIPPDMVIISLVLKSRDRKYETAMQEASRKLEVLQQAITEIGFSSKDLKTASLTVNTEYKSVRDKNDNYRSVFAGYSCVQGMNLEFDFDTKRLSQVLSTIAGCISEPELNIRFSVKDKAKVSEELLESAAVNAKEKAAVLTKASGKKLGELLTINYSWTEVDLYSDTRYGMEEKCLCAANDCAVDITPEDIDVSDSATFVWEME